MRLSLLQGRQGPRLRGRKGGWGRLERLAGVANLPFMPKMYVVGTKSLPPSKKIRIILEEEGTCCHRMTAKKPVRGREPPDQGQRQENDPCSPT